MKTEASEISLWRNKWCEPPSELFFRNESQAWRKYLFQYLGWPEKVLKFSLAVSPSFVNLARDFSGQKFFWPGIFHTEILQPGIFIPRDFTAKEIPSQGFYSQGFLYPGILQPKKFLARDFAAKVFPFLWFKTYIYVSLMSY